MRAREETPSASGPLTFADRITPALGDGPNLINHAFPIRKGLTVAVTLPEDLTMQEAARLSQWVRNLVVRHD